MDVYVDGRGGSSSGYGYFIPTMGDSHYVEKAGMTSNQAEYHAVLAALERNVEKTSHITIISDSQLIVSQLNHEYAIQNGPLRQLARQVWSTMRNYDTVTIRWVSRRNNLAGKMLG